MKTDKNGRPVRCIDCPEITVTHWSDTQVAVTGKCRAQIVAGVARGVGAQAYCCDDEAPKA